MTGMEPNIQNKKFYVDLSHPKWWQFVKKFGQRKAARKLHEWRLENESGYTELVRMQRERFALIEKATRAGLIAWTMDPEHYRAHPLYCKCPAYPSHGDPVVLIPEGTVDAHNARFDEVLRSVE